METIEWPFRATEALDAGTLTFRELRRFHRAVHPGVWVPRGVDLSSHRRARAAWLWSHREGILAGLSASAMLGTKWIADDGDDDVELIHAGRRPPRGIVLHGDLLAFGETQTVRGMAVTTPARTAFDLGRRLVVDEGVQRLDALMNATGVMVDDVEAVAARHPGVRGLRRLRETLALVDGGAESPYESLTRLLLIRAGFPPLETQIRVFDDHGFVFARIDMGWRQWQVGVDFEGAHHWSEPRQRSWDIERFARLPELGWNDVRLTSGILHNRPQSFLDRVGAALTARGCPKTW
jgi:hypothetical protein